MHASRERAPLLAQAHNSFTRHGDFVCGPLTVERKVPSLKVVGAAFGEVWHRGDRSQEDLFLPFFGKCSATLGA